MPFADYHARVGHMADELIRLETACTGKPAGGGDVSAYLKSLCDLGREIRREAMRPDRDAGERLAYAALLTRVGRLMTEAHRIHIGANEARWAGLGSASDKG